MTEELRRRWRCRWRFRPLSRARADPAAASAGRAEAGSATVLAVGVIAALASLTLGVLAVTSAVLALHTARSAADLAALAVAGEHQEGGSGGCAVAGDIAGAQGATVSRCHLDASGRVDVTTQVPITLPLPGVGPSTAEGRARAGPAPTEP